MLNLIENEEAILKYWSDNGIHEKANRKNKGSKVYFFMEGPPYANGELHMGHIRGYTRKDTIMRYKRMQGFDVFDKSGFDVHGLPIENKVERKLEIKSKREIESTIGVKNFLNECISLYKENVKGQIGVAIRYGVWMDFENAYIPATPQYTEGAWKVFKRIYEKGLVYKDTRVMPYCFHCGTALAKGPEVEEQEDTDPSVFVLFKVDKSSRLELPKDAYLLVWTTTPWTLPANMSIAVNPDALYVLAKLDGKDVILAKDRVDAVAQIVGSQIDVQNEFYGSELKDTTYINPLEEFVEKQRENRKYHKVLMSSEFVTLTDGTGLLHVAPAYGPEDFELAKKNKIPVMSIVDLEGIYNSLAGKYHGKRLIHEANRDVEVDLKYLGALVAKTTIRHNYPHCWRCKDKLVYLPTEQWFINIAKIKKRILRESEKVTWYPSELKEWFEGSIEQAPDWVISRQRYWGIAIPLWICDKCHDVKAIGSFQELEDNSNNEIKIDSESLHKPDIDNITLLCRKCQGQMHRIKDVFDVWYDSGVVHTAELDSEEFKRMYGKAFITEGPDQIRGWFATLMKTGVAAYNKSPFNTVLMQGWVLDDKGEAMHKSKGNYISGVDLIGKYSMDAIRAFMLSRVTYENLKFSQREIGEMQQSISTLYNISNLVREYADAIGYSPKIKKPRNFPSMEREDAWIISRFNSVVKNVTESLEKYEPHSAINTSMYFLMNDLSRFYLKIAKKKILENDKKSAKKKLDMINYILHDLIITLAPFVPFTSEKLYLDNFKAKESVFLEKWPKYDAKAINPELEQDFAIATDTITALLNDREKKKVRLRWPLSKAHIEVTESSAATSLERLSAIIEDYTNIKTVEVKHVSGASEEIRPVFARIGPDFKDRAAMVGEALKSADPKKVKEEIDKNGYYTLHTDNGPVSIKAEHFSIVKTNESEDAISFKYGKVAIDPKIDEGLREEAIVREFERRIQMVRKSLELKKVEKINVEYEAFGSLEGAIKKNLAKIKKNVNAKKISEKIKSAQDVESFDIEGDLAKLYVEKVQ